MVRKQIAAGIDVGNNGEQQREAFFLYVRQSHERVRRQLERAAEGRRRCAIRASAPVASSTPPSGSRQQLATACRRRSARCAISMPPRSQAECADFRATLDEIGGAGFAEPFMTAPSPGIIAAAMLNEYYDTFDAYLAALGEALRVEYETIVAQRLPAADRLHRTWRWNGMSPTRTSRSATFVDFVERVVATINDALRNIPRDSVRMHACWGNYEGPHDCDVDLAEILPAISRPRSAAGCCRSPIRGTRTNTAVLANLPLDDGQVVVAGRDRSADQFRRASRGGGGPDERVAQVVGDPTRVLAGTDCGFDTSAGRGPRGGGRGVGQARGAWRKARGSPARLF